MNANRYGDLVGGNGQGHHFLKLVGQPVRQIPGIDGGMWLDDETFLSRDSSNGYLVALRRVNGFTARITNWSPLYPAGVAAGNVWACGGSNWATTIMDAAGYRSWGALNGQPIPAKYQTDWAIMDASREGYLLWALNGQFEVLWHDGTIQAVGSANEARLNWDGGSVILLDGSGLRVVHSTELIDHVPLVSSVGLNKPALCGGYVSYATNDSRYVQHWSDTFGWTTTPVYAPELYAIDNTLHHAGALGPAELPSDLVIDLLDRPQGPLTVPPDPPDPPHPPEPTVMPNLYLKTRNGLFISSRVQDGTRKLFAQAQPDEFSVWKPILTRGTKVGEMDSHGQPINLVYFDLVNFPGNPIGLVPENRYDAVGEQAACAIRAGIQWTNGRGDDHDWTFETEPPAAGQKAMRLTLRQDKANAITLERADSFEPSLSSFRMVERKADGSEGKVYTEPFR